MNQFLQLSIEDTLQYSWQGSSPNASRPSNSNHLQRILQDYFSSSDDPFKGQKGLNELQSLFKYWYQSTIGRNTNKREAPNEDFLLSPALGVIFYRIYKQYESFSPCELRQFYEMYNFITDYHRFLYQWRDVENEGLISTRQELSAKKSATIQDPFFNAILSWSNECLIEIGDQLGEDVSEILEWHELTIYSMNDKLWNEQLGQYEIYHLDEGEQIPTPLHIALSPLLGEIPTQEQAEKMIAGKSAENLFALASHWISEIHLTDSPHLMRNMDVYWMVQNSYLRYQFWDLVEGMDLHADETCEEDSLQQQSKRNSRKINHSFGAKNGPLRFAHSEFSYI